MDFDFDATWCPVCARQIVPKRITVPVAPPQPAPPPSSPVLDPKLPELDATRLTRTKTGTIRARGGLAHGTGRVKPNGTIRRADPKKTSPVAPAVAPQPAPERPAAPVRQRTIIDQSPVPLYCSDECRLADLQSAHGAISIDYDPARCMSPQLPPVPPNSYTEFSALDDTDSASGGSLDSRSSLASSPPTSAPRDYPIPKSYAALQAIYDLPPLPPPPPLQRTESASSEASSNDYQSGVMMAARRIKEALCTEQHQPRPAWAAPPQRKPIPGWTDGSHAWRASVYSFAAPSEAHRAIDDEDAPRAYKSFVASSHRSRGVFSTMSDPDEGPQASSSASLPALAPSRSRSSADELGASYSLTFARRSESRASLAHLSTSPTGSTRSLPVSTSTFPRRREVSLVKPGAEGRLCVPNVKLSRTPSNLTVSSSEGPSSWSSYYPAAAARGSRRSPLSRQNSDASFDTIESEDELAETTMRGRAASSSSVPRRTMSNAPQSWSYTDRMTYPIMQLPPKKEKRIERRVVDGEERDVEVEVEVVQPLKRLFLFPGKEGARK